MIPKPRLFVAIVFLSCGLFAWSCRESAGPLAPIVGTYNVVNANGQRLPAVLSQTTGLTITLLSGSLTVGDMGSYETHNTQQATSSSGTTTISTGSRGQYYAIESGYVFTDSLGKGMGLLSLVGDTLSGQLSQVDYGFVRVSR